MEKIIMDFQSAQPAGWGAMTSIKNGQAPGMMMFYVEVKLAPITGFSALPPRVGINGINK
jgi:hypothetical protein